jgi:hypothetical protein
MAPTYATSQKNQTRDDQVRHTTIDEARNTQATGREPRDIGNVAQPATGQPGAETEVAKSPMPDVGNIVHTYDVAMTTSEIKGWRKP